MQARVRGDNDVDRSCVEQRHGHESIEGLKARERIVSRRLETTRTLAVRVAEAIQIGLLGAFNNNVLEDYTSACPHLLVKYEWTGLCTHSPLLKGIRNVHLPEELRHR